MPRIEKQDVNIADHAVFDPTQGYFFIKDLTLLDCRVFGPALVAPRGGRGAWIGNRFTGAGPRSVGIVHPVADPLPVAAIISDSLEIENCELIGISMIGTQDFIKRLLGE